MARFHLSLAATLAPSDTDDEDEQSEYSYSLADPISSPLILPSRADDVGAVRRGGGGGGGGGHDFSIMAALVAALRKSLICSTGVGNDGPCASPSIDVSWPTDVQHVAHVTFDRFSGFLGLPVEFEPEVPHRVPSASASVFGVSAKSMQCSYDSCGNSVPTILLSMQRHLYAQGGLQVEGIFRINAENSQELYVRDQLNRGIVPHGVDMHCLAGLIKAWFRELPTGVLDSLTPDQVMHCNTEEECSELVTMLPPTEAALLNWAINLMSDVVEKEQHNKMNARNIAMIFAPNMTQMADPLTALIHAVQVMNFLKTLIIKMLREREDAAAAEAKVFHSCSESPRGGDTPNCAFDRAAFDKLLFSGEHSLECDGEERFCCSPVTRDSNALEDGSEFEYSNRYVDGLLHKLSFREGVRKLCRHPVFQLSKSVKKLSIPTS